MRICPTCGEQHNRSQAYCLACHAAYQRKWRRTHRLTAAQKKRDNARSYAGVYLRRGKLKRKPCVVCGSKKAEMHHPDYDRPLYIVWLCREHHLALHSGEFRLSMAA